MEAARRGIGLHRSTIRPEVRMKTKVLCLLPHLSDSRIAQRIKMLQQAGFQVEAVAFENRHYPGPLPDCPVESLGRFSFRSYYLRVPSILTRLRRIRAAIRRNDIIYCFYLEMGLAALMSGAGLGKPLFLEVHDIKRHQLARGPKGRLVRLADKVINRACSLLTLTSAGYYAYYRDWLKLEPATVVIENKVDQSLGAAILAKGAPDSTGAPLEDRPLRIGYFGLLKDEWSMQVLESLAATAPEQFEFVLAGTANRIANFPQRIARIPNMEYRGIYQNPDDLESLYGGVDMSLACYPPPPPHGWAQSNRYYEACLFRRPLIVRAGTQDAVEVERHGIGLVIADGDVDGAAAAICGITPADWRRWRANMEKLPLKVYAYTDEADLLGRLLTGAGGRANR